MPHVRTSLMNFWSTSQIEPKDSGVVVSVHLVCESKAGFSI
jgi:hypothetical protein